MRVDFCIDLLIFDSRSDHDSKGNGGMVTSVTLLLLGVTPVYQDSGVMRIVRPGPDNTSLSRPVLTEFTTARV